MYIDLLSCVRTSDNSASAVCVEMQASSPKQHKSLERTETAKVDAAFVEEVSHELSAEELDLIRSLVKLTSTTPKDEEGVFPNKLDASNASKDAVEVAEDLMARTSYAFNFIHHGQHKSGNIRALLEKHTEGIPHSTTTKLNFANKQSSKVRRPAFRNILCCRSVSLTSESFLLSFVTTPPQREVDKSLQMRSGMTSLNLAVEIRSKTRQKPQLTSIASERSLDLSDDGSSAAATPTNNKSASINDDPAPSKSPSTSQATSTSQTSSTSQTTSTPETTESKSDASRTSPGEQKSESKTSTSSKSPNKARQTAGESRSDSSGKKKKSKRHGSSSDGKRESKSSSSQSSRSSKSSKRSQSSQSSAVGEPEAKE